MKIELEMTPAGTPRIKSALIHGRHVDFPVSKRSVSMGAAPVAMEPRGNFVRDVAYSKFADLAVKGSAAAMSAAILSQQNSTFGKILFGVTTAALGTVAAASAYEALG